MPERTVTVTLESSGGTVTSAAGVLHHFTPAERVLRAALLLLLGVAAAATLIPIPIIHLIGIPLALVVGLLTAGRQLAASARLMPMRLACPNCGAMNRVGGGLGYRNAVAPMDIHCDSCRRGLTLRFSER